MRNYTQNGEMGVGLRMSDNPWEAYPEIWATKSAFFSWLRGGLRRAIWEKYPPKISYKKKQLTKPPDGYVGKARSGAICALTGAWTGNSKLQVDHIVGEASLRDWDDVLPFIRHLCTNDDNMQLVEVEAHKVKSYAERHNLTFEDALLEKKVISFRKLSATEQKKKLQEMGVCDIMSLSTVAKRTEKYRSILKGETNES